MSGLQRVVAQEFDRPAAAMVLMCGKVWDRALEP